MMKRNRFTSCFSVGDRVKAAREITCYVPLEFESYIFCIASGTDGVVVKANASKGVVEFKLSHDPACPVQVGKTDIILVEVANPLVAVG